MAIISGGGLPNATTPAQIKADTNPADLGPIRIDIPSAQTNTNALEIYKAGVLVGLIDASGNLFSPSQQGFNSEPNEGLITVAMAADANQTLSATQAQSYVLQIAGGATLTATRNIVVPVIAGAQHAVFNNATGAQSLQFIGASGTGVTVATGKRAIIYCDGTNWVRLTPDT